jgi:ABC-type phosphate/phosphonate transport system substrate-binding protein
MRGVSLPMYDFPQVRESTNRILEALVEALRRAGEDVDVVFPENTAHHNLVEHWESPDTYLSQSCGLPFVEHLYSFVDVIGTLGWSGISDERGWYRTVIVARETLGIDDIADVAGLRPVISNPASLSGWCSLGWALAQVSDDPHFVEPHRIGGGHRGSLRMLQEHEADFASIDPGTFQLLARHEPELVSGLSLIGYGPQVPATPLHITKRDRHVDIDRIRMVVAEAFASPALADARVAIGIDGFVPLDNAPYLQAIPPLFEVAQRRLPR